MSHRLAQRDRQHGLATLVFTLMLVSLMLLAALFVNRHLLIEQRSAANQFRAVQAFEAAEAGLEWATAQLNNPQPLGPDCLVSTSRSATTFRDRQFRIDASSGQIVVPPPASPLQPTRAACVRSGDAGWSCACPLDSLDPRDPRGSLTPPAGTATAPMFAVDITPGTRPGVVQLRSVGCTAPAGCFGDRLGTAEAAASVAVSLRLVPALRAAPAAAVTARGAIEFETGTRPLTSMALPAGFIAHAGGAIRHDGGAIAATSGDTLGQARFVEYDETLAATPPPQLFATIFGIGKWHWQQQPAATRIDCRGDCTRALRRLLESPAPPALLWIDGDVALDGPLAIGSPQRPVVLVSTGALSLRGAVQAHGVLYAASVAWHDAGAPGALLRGAIVSESTFVSDTMAPLAVDTAVLATLRRTSGSFVRIAGSWRDF